MTIHQERSLEQIAEHEAYLTAIGFIVERRSNPIAAWPTNPHHPERKIECLAWRKSFDETFNRLSTK